MLLEIRFLQAMSEEHLRESFELVFLILSQLISLLA